ncbi:MAG: hypothetical protein GFH27_549281n65 [Chloroflexi bacterium AL-W]|nr:hypothetical protein [Chloroflexi bacterium AL-N1]NOK65951.1 hypothetical protein [Chloroflexi bacterium AL-N10]NOK72832.1 hypothetical protein [Chloroflexi bacterium AL-N5]NOK79729.1 hypothetical protein [Chloroflexi bacterium AL-W]NOK88415.1 hypothetical protein [Chloroflexi bacterium AL-N15]
MELSAQNGSLETTTIKQIRHSLPIRCKEGIVPINGIECLIVLVLLVIVAGLAFRSGFTRGRYRRRK